MRNFPIGSLQLEIKCLIVLNCKCLGRQKVYVSCEVISKTKVMRHFKFDPVLKIGAVWISVKQVYDRIKQEQRDISMSTCGFANLELFQREILSDAYLQNGST